MRAARTWFSAACVATALAFTPALLGAQAKPANATAECKDGTFSTAQSKRGACSGHGGIRTWFADEGSRTKADAKAAAKDTKSAAKDAGDATKDVGKSAAKKTKEAAKGTAGAAATAGSETKSAAKSAGSETKSAAKGADNAARSAANEVKPKPSDAPQDATAKCKDGSYSHAKQHRGACSGHGGVAEWYK